MPILTVDDARAALNMPEGSANAVELRLYCLAADEVIRSLCGPVLPEDVTETVTVATGATTALLSRPASEITAVTDNGTELVEDDWATSDLTAGILRVPKGLCGPLVAVEYSVGLEAIPSSVRLAARELVRFWWQQGQQGGRPAFGGSGAPGVSTAYAVPDRVVELLAPHMAGRMPGFA